MLQGNEEVYSLKTFRLKYFMWASFLMFHMDATCLSHLIHFDVITLTVLGGKSSKNILFQSDFHGPQYDMNTPVSFLGRPIHKIFYFTIFSSKKYIWHNLGNHCWEEKGHPRFGENKVLRPTEWDLNFLGTYARKMKKSIGLENNKILSETFLKVCAL